MVPQGNVNPLIRKGFLWPTLGEIRIEQESCIGNKKDFLFLTKREACGFAPEKFLIPDSKNPRIRGCIVGHAGSVDHRGYVISRSSIEEHL
jgi:hypothetical protein